jgi:putative ABC transport system permease protein
MRLNDTLKLSLQALVGQRMRSGLTALGIAVGIAAVVLLTSLGEGIHRFVLAEFTQFGTNLIAINPGKTNTMGFSGAVISNVRPLSLADAEALAKLPRVIAAMPFVQGNAAVEFDRRTRRTYIFGVGPEVPIVWQMNVSRGRFLPDDDPRAARAYIVLGSKVKNELFGNANALGQAVAVGGERYRVIGIMESKGQMLGFDLDDAVYIPVMRAMALFNRQSLMEIDVLYTAGSSSAEVAARIKTLLMARHGGEDFTITTQDQMLEVLGSILGILTMAVGALGGISLLVGGVGILTIMTISVAERTSEIGLLRALGARRAQVLLLFLAEATLLAAVGGLFGLLLGYGVAQLLHAVFPALPVSTPWLYAVLAELIAVGVGMAAGVAPANRASRLDPVEALRAK